MNRTWVVMKFGGTSVGSRRALRRAVAAVRASHGAERVAVVVSALARVTNALESAAARAARGEAVAAAFVRALRQRHVRLARALAPGEAARARESLTPVLARLRTLLEQTARTRTLPAERRAEILASGERLAVQVVTAALRGRGLPATAVDATALLVAGGVPLEAQPDLPATRARVESWSAPELPVITGFLAAGPDGGTWLFGRGGSDLSASVLAHALRAVRVEIWTDTPGVLTADPRHEPQARTHRALRPATAARLAQLGARVLHPRTLEPLLAAARAGERPASLWVRDTFHPEAAGTRIERGAAERLPSVVGAPALVRVASDAGGPPARLATQLRAQGIPVLLSPLDDTLLVPASAVASVRATALAGLRYLPGPLRARLVSVNARRAPTPDHIAAVLAASGVFALAPPAALLAGAVGAAVAESDVPAAVRALHAAFVHTRTPRVDVVLAGARGRVGRELLARLSHAGERSPLRLVAAFDTRGFVADPRGLPPADVARRLAGAAPRPLARILAGLSPRARTPLVFVDCTASEALAARHAVLLARGVGVVTANKHGMAAGSREWRTLARAARRAPLRASATVGAGLPVLSTVRALAQRGDALLSLRATLSGTLAHVLDAVNAGVPLSRAVAEARALGFTEPHPAADLSGADVGRKLLIVLRSAGLVLEPEQVRVEPLVPAELLDTPTAAAFETALTALDETFAARARQAQAAGRRLVYAATFDAGGARAGLLEVAATDPLALARPGENVVRLRTALHDRVPLEISGPGAGPAVTAASVHGDLLAAARALLRRARHAAPHTSEWPQPSPVAGRHPAWA